MEKCVGNTERSNAALGLAGSHFFWVQNKLDIWDSGLSFV